LSGAGHHWYLIGASPDIAAQIELCQHLWPDSVTGQTPIRGVLLTDAELDHTIGLLVLREGGGLEIRATTAVLSALEHAFPIKGVTEPYRAARWIAVEPHNCFCLDGLEVTAFRLGEKRLRYTADHVNDGDWVIGYRIRDIHSGGIAVWAPCIPRWTSDLQAALNDADWAFVDGTFWCEDEMSRTGRSALTATQMGHLPISGDAGTATRLAAVAGCRSVYVHINNTNPVLDRDSPERAWLDAMGLTVGWDGMEVAV
jgi:pyrroloquinoline quinone biosynthesis protein B